MLPLTPPDAGLPHAGADAAVHLRLLSALVDRIACGVLACGSSGELLHANGAARVELRSGALLRLDAGRVCAAPPMQPSWAGALREATLQQRTRLLCLEQADERRMVALLPVHAEGAAQPVSVVVIGQRDVCSALGLDLLAASHGLTQAEQRVLRALVENRSPREIAALHGVSIGTVRVQIRAVRAKLGARSIDALLLQAAVLPPVTVR